MCDRRISSLVDTRCMCWHQEWILQVSCFLFLIYFWQNLCQTELLHVAASCATQEGFSQHLSSDNKDLVSTSRLWSLVPKKRQLEATYWKVAKWLAYFSLSSVALAGFVLENPEFNILSCFHLRYLLHIHGSAIGKLVVAWGMSADEVSLLLQKIQTAWNNNNNKKKKTELGFTSYSSLYLISILK